jgi:hypothetical protein
MTKPTAALSSVLALVASLFPLGVSWSAAQTPPQFASPVDTNGWQRISWGQARSNLCFGAISVSSSARRRSGPDVLFYICNVGPTDAFLDWIAPPGFQRVTLKLYDQLGREVLPWTGNGTLTNRAYRNLKDVPKRQSKAHEGRMGLFPMSPLTYSQTNIAANFRLSGSGDYRLVAEGHVLRVNRTNLNLSPFAIPTVSIPLHVVDGGVDP